MHMERSHLNSRLVQAELLTQKVYLLVLTCLMVILTGSSSEVAGDRMSLFVVVGVLELGKLAGLRCIRLPYT